MSYTIHITSTAERDLNRAADYIEFDLKNPQSADRLLDEAQQQINALSQYPKKYPLVKDKVLASWGIRFTLVNNYLAFYIVSDEQNLVTIVRFLYTKSSWVSILRSGFPIT